MFRRNFESSDLQKKNKIHDLFCQVHCQQNHSQLAILYRIIKVNKFSKEPLNDKINLIKKYYLSNI